MSIPQKYIDNYFKRFAITQSLINDRIDPRCKTIIVIPCHNEPDLIGTLNSLLENDSPSQPLEVIIVVNQAITHQGSVVELQNKETIASFNVWNDQHKSDSIKFHLIESLDMPPKHAGVGLARKIGMDEAFRRFVSIDTNGTIVCLDADCRVSKNYLVSIDKQFSQSSAGLGEVNFEHSFQLEHDDALKKGIVNYELFLRYYVEGLRSADFPYAIQTIGSCMLVKASVYAKHGGMNKRKAGEDFYFLHKIIPHETFLEVSEGTVYPSCRTSDRVPFGTGKAQQDWLNQEKEDYLTYDPRVFLALKSLIRQTDSFFQSDAEQVTNQLPPIPQSFIKAHGFSEKIELIKSNCRTSDQFRKQFFIWFDGFLCMKFVHFTRDEYYPNIPIRKAIDTSGFPWDERTLQLIRSCQ